MKVMSWTTKGDHMKEIAKDKATARPWSVNFCEASQTHFIEGLEASPFGDDVCYNIRNKANASLIVKAVNNHEALLEACESLIRSYVFHCPDADKQSIAIKNAREAINAVSK
jgi:hypothetical protein